MNKKSTLILLSILHICILGICILTIYNNKHSNFTTAHVSSDTRTAIAQNDPDTMAGPETDIPTTEEAETESEIETESETETEIQIQTERTPEAETKTVAAPKISAQYSFHYIGRYKNLNIRNAPSINAKIIGKVPIGGCGIVLELTNENWVLAEYNDIVGYCSRDWIELQKITE